jgi:hypothetical protein
VRDPAGTAAPVHDSGGTILALRDPAMSWFQVSRGRLRFRGVTRQPFDDWIASREGAAAVDAAAQQIRFSLIGRANTARRRIRRELQAVVASRPVRAVLAAEPDHYLRSWTALAYAPSLPRLTIALHRLVVVPRTMILTRTVTALTGRLAQCPGFADLDSSFQTFLAHRVLAEMNEAISRVQPSARAPIALPESWVCVAIDRAFLWVDPLWLGEEWLGHVVLFEMPRRGLDRRERRELSEAIERITRDLPSMSRYQRSGLVRTATADLRTA